MFVQHQLLLLFITVLCFMTTTGKNQLATLYAYTHTPHDLCCIISGSATSCGNNGPFKCLGAAKDVWVESGYGNYNSYKFLIFGKHLYYPKKRLLIQFDDIPSSCGNVVWAKLYLKYYYSHKPSWVNAKDIHRTVQVHQVKKDWHKNINFKVLFIQIKKEWSETQVIRIYCKSGLKWSKPYLALDGSDANADSMDTVAFPPTKPWLQLDITQAARNWKNGEKNCRVVIWATNENDDGRDICFFSREYWNNFYRPRLFLLCN